MDVQQCPACWKKGVFHLVSESTGLVPLLRVSELRTSLRLAQGLPTEVLPHHAASPEARDFVREVGQVSAVVSKSVLSVGVFVTLVRQGCRSFRPGDSCCP